MEISLLLVSQSGISVSSSASFLKSDIQSGSSVSVEVFVSLEV